MKRIIELLKGFGVLLLYLLLPSLLVLIIKLFVNNISDKVMVSILILIQLICALVLMLLYRKTLINDFKNMKENYKSHLNIAFKYWCMGLIAMVVFNYIINIIINPGGLAVNEEMNRTLIDENILYAIVAVLICAPIMEELVFRAAFKKAFKKAITFAIFSGLLFASLHVTTAFIEMESFSEIIKNWKELLYLFPYGSLGFAFGYTYYKTDNIFSTIIVHFAHNLMTVILILLVL